MITYIISFLSEKSSVLRKERFFMRNPNGWGSVVKLSGNRRKPYMARKITDWTDDTQYINL